MSNRRLDIVSVGAVTAVGLSAPASCAAFRAGLDGFQETRFVDSEGEWLIGAPIPLPRQWLGGKRLGRMLAAAITEAFERVPEAKGRTALVLCLAEDERVGRPVQDVEAFLVQLTELLGVEIHSRSYLVSHGRASGHVALKKARDLIYSQQAPYVMVAGVDSYLTPATVAHYLGNRRLLTSDNPNGFIPGEAAAAVLCGRAEASAISLLGVGLGSEKGFIYNQSDIPLRGEGMSIAYRTALDETGIGLHDVGYVLSDAGGEQYWFKQSALANLRLMRVRIERQPIISPCESVGNVGAAVGPLMIAMAWTAATKMYAVGNPVLIEASNDKGACGAAILAARARA